MRKRVHVLAQVGHGLSHPTIGHRIGGQVRTRLRQGVVRPVFHVLIAESHCHFRF